MTFCGLVAYQLLKQLIVAAVIAGFFPTSTPYHSTFSTYYS